MQIVNATLKISKRQQQDVADDYMYIQGKPALTIELSKKGFCDATSQVTQLACTNVLDTITKTLHTISLESIANWKPEVPIYTTIHREPYRSRDYRLQPNLYNFTPVKKGQHLEDVGSPEIIAPFDGCLLFPKYPSSNKPLPNEILESFSMIQPGNLLN